MLVTNLTADDYWFGPLRLPASGTLTIDDSSPDSLYLLSDAVADALAALVNSNKITVGSVTTGIVFPRATGSPEVLHGDGFPEGLVYAPQGSLYMRRDAASNTNYLFTKTTGVTLNTGWTPINPAGGTGAPATTLPAGPVDGQQAVLVDSTSSPTYSWLMQYSVAASKWLFLGGSSWNVYASSTQTISGAGTTDITSMTYTVPRAGLYQVEWSASVSGHTAGDGVTVQNVANGTTGRSHAVSMTGNGFFVPFFLQDQSTVSASQVIKAQVVTGEAGSVAGAAGSLLPIYLT